MPPRPRRKPKTKVWVEAPDVEMEMPGPAQENQVDRPFAPTVTHIYGTYRQTFVEFQEKRRREKEEMQREKERERQRLEEQQEQERVNARANLLEKKRLALQEKRRAAEQNKKTRAKAREAKRAEKAAKAAKPRHTATKPQLSPETVAEDAEKSDDVLEDVAEAAPPRQTERAPARRPAKRRKMGGFLDDSDTENDPAAILAEPVEEAPLPHFLRLPLEIREEIYAYLLAPDAGSKIPVRVCNGWTEMLKGRANRSLGTQRHTAIMRVNSRISDECVSVLYGQNVFEYYLRDPSGEEVEEDDDEGMVATDDDGHEADDENDDSDQTDSDGDYYEGPKTRPRPATRRAAAPVLTLTRARARAHYKDFDDSVQINVRKFGHYFRNIRIRAEPGRSSPAYRTAMAQAIQTFCSLEPLRAHIHTLTLEVTPQRDPDDESVVTFVDFFAPGGEVIAALRRLPCQFIRVIAHTDLPDEKTGVRETEIMLDMRYAARMRRAHRGEPDIWAGDDVAMASRRAGANKAQKRMLTLHKKLEQKWEQLEMWIDELGRPITREDYEIQMAEAELEDGFWD